MREGADVLLGGADVVSGGIDSLVLLKIQEALMVLAQIF